MIDLNEIWDNVQASTDVKTLWFETPEDATEYLEQMIEDVSNNIQIANEDDEEIGKGELLTLFDDYRKSQEDKLYFRLVESNVDYLIITLECWELHNDYDCCADVLTISK